MDIDLDHRTGRMVVVVGLAFEAWEENLVVVVVDRTGEGLGPRCRRDL